MLQNDEDQRELGGLRQEVARAEKTCQELEDKNQVTIVSSTRDSFVNANSSWLQSLRTELKTKDAKLSSTTSQLEKTARQLEQANAQVSSILLNLTEALQSITSCLKIGEAAGN